MCQTAEAKAVAGARWNTTNSCALISFVFFICETSVGNNSRCFGTIYIANTTFVIKTWETWVFVLGKSEHFSFRCFWFEWTPAIRNEMSKTCGKKSSDYDTIRFGGKSINTFGKMLKHISMEYLCILGNSWQRTCEAIYRLCVKFKMIFTEMVN